jgi:hypothetical protein
MEQQKEIEVLVQATPDKQISLTDPDARSMATSGRGTGVVGYNVQTAVDAQHHLIVAHEVTNVGNDRGQLAAMAQQAQTAMGRKDLEVVADQGDQAPEKMEVRRQTVEHPFGTIKAWMGATHFLMKTLGRVSTEMRLHVLAYNLKRVMKVPGIVPLMKAMQA